MSALSQCYNYHESNAHDSMNERMESQMEVAVKPKKQGLLGLLLKGHGEAAEAVADECEHFAYRRTLLYYANDCRYCRYAQKINGGRNGQADYLCTYAGCDEHHAG